MANQFTGCLNYFSVPNTDSDSSSDDDNMIGPCPPKPGEEISEEDSIARSIEARAQKMKDRLEGKITINLVVRFSCV